MALVVQKYGGSSLADAERIRRVAERIVATRRLGNDVVVVVSAMGDTTDELLELAERVSPLPPARELDMLLTAGERIAMALLAMAIQSLGLEARSFTGSQAGVITDSSHGRARIIDVTPGRIRGALDAGAIAIVAGFQGVSQDTKDVTTLGRGGSDTTAVALAAALHAEACEIYTDVDGVFTADPRLVPHARRLRTIGYEEMLELAASGARVLMLRCVEYARRNGMPVHVRSSFSTTPGTWVTDGPPPADFDSEQPASEQPDSEQPGPGQHDRERDRAMEQAIISGVAHDRSEAKVTVVAVPDKPGEAAAIFRALADAGINLDMIVQNVSAAATGRTDISFTLAKADGVAAVAALDRVRPQVGFDSIRYDDHIGKVSLVGAGMRTNPGVPATFFEALAEAGVNVEIISTSEIRISIVCRDTDVPTAVTAVHDAFGLGVTSPAERATVYAGTGR